MTDISEVMGNKNYKKVLDKGFVGLISHMGSDEDIANSARVSYGNGTKTVRQNEGLIRYLVKHEHTSPIEMGEVKLHIKLPIFVMRQLVRHRTASLNEISARYSEMVDDFYIPELEHLQPQSKVNNQGRNGSFDEERSLFYQKKIKDVCDDSYATYKELIKPIDEANGELGLARELARMVLPINLYTEVYWKQDLKNLLHLIRLRADPHAQWEIQQFANAIYELIQPLFPATIKAFDDYKRGITTVTRTEKDLLKKVMNVVTKENTFESKLNSIIELEYENDVSLLLSDYGLSKREYSEFIENWK